MKTTKDRLLSLIMEGARQNRQEGFGLFKGDMGVCLALFVLNREKKDPAVEDFADHLIDRIYARAAKAKNAFFDTGFAGVGWGVNYLMENHYYEGDVDEVLKDIDAVVFKEINSVSGIPANVSNGLLGYLIYSVARLGNPGHAGDTVLHEINTEFLRELIVQIDGISPTIFSSICKDEYFTSIWHVPVLLMMFRKALDLGVFNDKIVNMVKTWLFYLETNQPYLHINKLYLAVSLAYLNEYLCFPEIRKRIEILMFSVDLSQIEGELDVRIMNINDGWFGAVAILKKAEDLLDANVPHYEQLRETRIRIVAKYGDLFDKYLDEANKEKPLDISFIQGLSGVGFLLSVLPEAFSS